MRLISCDIENFGKISGGHFDFTNGCNIICEDNGWGKSTLAAFIRVMFFGFENANVRDEINNERKRFTPWQGGVYGGKIVFEADGHKYVLSRIFGTKEKDDKFSLRDYETNLETDAFSANIGIELFKIDGKSFARSVYISQNDCDTEITDSINAKLGNLAENTDDINNFDKVDKKLKDFLNKMSPVRSTGSLHKMKSEISEYEQHIRQEQVIDKSMQELFDLKNSEKNHYDELKEKQQNLQIQKAHLSKIKDCQALKEKYLGIKKEYMEKNNKLIEAEKFFKGDVPKQEKLETVLKNAAIVWDNENEIARCSINEAEADKLDKYKKIFSEDVPAAEEINNLISKWNMRNEKKNSLSIKRNNLEFKRSMLKENGQRNLAFGTWIFAVIAGSVLALAGIGVFFVQKITGIILLAAGIVTLMCGIILKRKNMKTGQGQTQIPDFTMEEAQIQEDEEFINITEEKTKNFLDKYGRKFDEYTVNIALGELKQEADEYTLLREKEKEMELLVNDEEIKTIRVEIDDFIKKYYNDISYDVKDISRHLYEIESNLQRYLEYRKELDQINAVKKAFEVENDIEAILNTAKTDNTESMEKLDLQLDSISAELEDIHTHMLDYTVRLEKLQYERDKISDEKEYLSGLKEIFDKEQKKYRLLGKTKELLENAKVSFTLRYMGPITEGFNKYYSILTGTPADKYSIDANAEVYVDEMGLLRDRRCLSTGYRDLTGICMRMAFVDAMYKGEKPFVIFDDPFVSLDEEKTAGGTRLLKEIGKEYQVIYFTCHNSRTI